MIAHELVSMRVDKLGNIEVWILSSVTKDGGSYRHVGTITAKLLAKAQTKAADR